MDESAKEGDSMTHGATDLDSTMTRLVHDLDWVAAAPGALDAPLSICLSSTFPTAIYWGEELRLIYNDAWAPILADRHPASLGQPAHLVWPDIWPVIAPQMAQVIVSGKGFCAYDQMLPMKRQGRVEETYWNYSFTPIVDSDGKVAGIFNQGNETTLRVHEERRQALRLALDEAAHNTPGPADLIIEASALLGRHLAVERVGYAEMDESGEHAVIHRDWTDASVPSLAGALRLDSFGLALARELREGRSIRIDDALSDPLSKGDGTAEAFAAVGVRATIDVPLIRDGRLAAILFVHSASIRHWADHEVAFSEEVAERIWAAVERARADVLLRESEERYRQLLVASERRSAELSAVLESMPDAVYIGGSAGITLVNAPALDQLGFTTREELNREIGTLAEEIRTRDPVTGAPIAVEDQVFSQALNGRTMVRDVVVRHRGTGEDRIVRSAAAPVMIEGKVIAAVAVNTDVTERRRAEAALRDLNETLERRVDEALAERRLWAEIFESSDALINAVDSDYRFLAFNRAYADMFERLYGIRPALGDHLFDLIGERAERRDSAWQRWSRALAGEDVVTLEALGLPGEEKEHYELRLSPLRDKDGLVIGAYQYVIDVTQRVRDQQRLEEAENALRQSQKLEAMGQLTGGVAHDFNNLLTPIVINLDLLQRRSVGDDKSQRQIAGALQAADRAKTLVQRLLAFARRQPLQPEAIDVGAIIETMADLVVSTCGPRITVKTRIEDGLPAAMADANQIEMAVLNLAVNARDAMPDGGTLSIEAACVMIDAEQAVGLTSGHYIRLSVRDSGMGMSEATRARAIEPFFSTKGIGKGTGLGLSMVHGLALQLGGALTIDSALGKGTCIDLWLRLARSAPETKFPESQSADNAGVGKVLLVDDDDLVRMSTADMLEDLGYQVEEAASGEEALALLAEGLRPDLLLTDHLMPGITGIELAGKIRTTIPTLPVLLVSGYAEDSGIPPDFPRLIKPFRRDDLGSSLAALMQKPKTI